MRMIPTLPLSDGTSIPQLGLGVWQMPDDGAGVPIQAAFNAGYRAIDTAPIYGNEEGVGRAIRASGLPRKELYITTKVWNSTQGYDSTLRAVRESLGRLQLEYVDLYLIHWPVPKIDRYVDTWKALAQIKADGLARSIGVSNFTPVYLQRLFDETGIVPVVNQVELHPRLQQHELRAFHAKHRIVTEAWSPLGQGTLLADPVLAGIAQKHGRSAAQVIIRWHIQQGLVVIPKSVTPSRIAENANVFDFTLDAEDMAAIASLDAGEAGRIGSHPDKMAMGV
ncbi:aldo/keto reductase [Opitutaceae bacterium TAV4]|nr:aldo/keto reductase [Opitutaceae bacterium TAV4]RRJ99968.1 aldo/keto reductase [Opitutaceae bacterium TAV3]